MHLCTAYSFYAAYMQHINRGKCVSYGTQRNAKAIQQTLQPSEIKIQDMCGVALCLLL